MAAAEEMTLSMPTNVLTFKIEHGQLFYLVLLSDQLSGWDLSHTEGFTRQKYLCKQLCIKFDLLFVYIPLGVMEEKT